MHIYCRSALVVLLLLNGLLGDTVSPSPFLFEPWMHLSHPFCCLKRRYEASKGFVLLLICPLICGTYTKSISTRHLFVRGHASSVRSMLIGNQWEGTTHRYSRHCTRRFGSCTVPMSVWNHRGITVVLSRLSTLLLRGWLSVTWQRSHRFCNNKIYNWALDMSSRSRPGGIACKVCQHGGMTSNRWCYSGIWFWVQGENPRSSLSWYTGSGVFSSRYLVEIIAWSLLGPDIWDENPWPTFVWLDPAIARLRVVPFIEAMFSHNYYCYPCVVKGELVTRRFGVVLFLCHHFFSRCFGGF